MSTTTESPFSLTVKVGKNHDSLLTGRADTLEEMIQRVKDLVRLRDILDGKAPAQPAASQHDEAVALVEQELGAEVLEDIDLADGGPEEVTDKYGAKFTYGLAEAPRLPDGRGNYIKKDWIDRSGKRRVAWVDPVKGPKPFAKGESEAKLIFI